MAWEAIKDSHVRHIWKCEDEECEENNPEVDIGPDFYQDNGEPQCGCGVNMIYQRTEINI